MSKSRTSIKLYGTDPQEKMLVLTGTVERVIKWHSIFVNQLCIYEVIASVISIQEGTLPMQRIMLLRDKKGPVLQVIYFITTHLDINDFSLGQVLRCVGNMIGPNILKAVSIRTATQGEISTLQRFYCICDRAIDNLINE